MRTRLARECHHEDRGAVWQHGRNARDTDTNSALRTLAPDRQGHGVALTYHAIDARLICADTKYIHDRVQIWAALGARVIARSCGPVHGFTGPHVEEAASPRNLVIASAAFDTTSVSVGK